MVVHADSLIAVLVIDADYRVKQIPKFLVVLH